MMDNRAYELLDLINECEITGHREMIPVPWKLRMDAGMSDALDSLLDNGFVKVCRPDHVTAELERIAITLGFFEPYLENLRITDLGRLCLVDIERNKLLLLRIDSQA